MLKIRHVFMILAMSLLIAHMVIPHVHHQQLYEGEEIGQPESAKSFLDYIKIALHTDLGSNHLEVYYGQDTNFDQVITCTDIETFNLSPALETISEKPVISSLDIQYSIVEYDLIESRGPPRV